MPEKQVQVISGPHRVRPVKMLHSGSLLLRRHRKAWYGKQTRGAARTRLLSLLIILGVLVALHTLAMLLLEDLGLWQAFWLTLTTITTVGYGDLSAESMWGQLATVVFLYIPGIALLGQFLGEYIDYRVTRREHMLQGLWRWKMKDHILILNTPMYDGDLYLERLIQQISTTPELRELPIQILTPVYPDGLPPSLQALGVVHYSGTPTNSQNLERVNASEARYIFVISHNAASINPDSQTIDILEHLNSIPLKAYVVAECVDDENRVRFTRLAADTAIRPVRAYPELVVRAMVAPGTEQVMEDMFTYHGAHQSRYNVEIEGLAWKEVVCSIMQAGLGTAIAYVNKQGELFTSPRADDKVDASALILMVRQDEEPEAREIQSCLKASQGV
ncbi:MAG: transporter [Gammaproteobacteria bacterium]|nr:transporter [Gammaproteobacteria bacterium]